MSWPDGSAAVPEPALKRESGPSASGVVRRGPPAGASVGGLRQQATRLARSLAELEQRFGIFGNRLHLLSQRGRAVERLAGEIAGTLSSGEMREYLAKGQSALLGLEGCEDTLTEGIRAFEGELAAFASGLGVVGASIDELKAFAKELWMLSIATRVHSATVGSGRGDFSVLATDLALLSKVNRQRAVQLGKGLERMRSMIGRYQARGGDRGHGGDTALPVAVREIAAGLEGFSGALDAAAENSLRLSTWPRDAAGTIDRLIISLQYHDIIRQRLEGFLAALDAAEAAAAGERRLPRSPAAPLGTAPAVADLQSVGTGITRMLRDMMLALQELSETIIERTEAFRKAIHPESSFLTSVAALVARIEAIMDAELEGEREAIAAMEGLHGIAAETLTCFDDTRSGREDLAMLAVNARIRSANCGDRGRGLDEVASAIQVLARREKTRPDLAAERVRGMDERARGMLGDMRQRLQRCRGAKDEVLGALRRDLDLVRERLEGIASIEGQLHDAGRDMVREIADLLKALGDVTNRKQDLLELISALDAGSPRREAPAAGLPQHAQAGGSVELF